MRHYLGHAISLLLILPVATYATKLLNADSDFAFYMGLVALLLLAAYAYTATSELIDQINRDTARCRGAGEATNEATDEPLREDTAQ